MKKEYFLDRISKLYPDNFKKNNYDLLPNEFRAIDKIPIECYTHGVFYQKAMTQLSGHNCQKCGLIFQTDKRRLSTEEFIKLSKNKFGDRFGYGKTICKGRNKKLTLTCTIHGDFNISALKHLESQHGCQKCNKESRRKASLENFLRKAREIHGDSYTYNLDTYKSLNHKIEITCQKHGLFKQKASMHVFNGSKCRKCSIENDRLSLEQFIELARSKHGNKYDYSKVVYETNNSTIIVICPIHGEFQQIARSHLRGHGCRKCHTESSMRSRDDFIKNAKSKHGDKYDYSKVVYRGNKKLVEIICPSHGSFWLKPNSHTSKSTGCRFCNESKGEKAVESFLIDNGFNFIREFRIKPYLYRYDFYLKDFNIYIEFNGAQHYMPVEVFGGKEAFIKTRENDKHKREIVKNLGGKLIILTYLQLEKNTISNAIKKELKSIYPYWLLVNDQIKAFKNPIELCRFFDLPTDILVSNLLIALQKKRKDVKILF